MAIFASTTLGSSDPSRAASIKALEARAQALAQAQAKQEVPQSVPSPWQGIGNLANTAADAFTARRADQAAAQRRQDLAGYIAKAGDNPSMADVGQITAADTDVGKAYLTEIQQRRSQAAQIQAQKEIAAQKAQQDLEFAAKQEELLRGRPQSDIGKLAADVGRKPTEEEVQAEIRKKTQPSPSDQEAIGKAKTENIDLQTTAAQLAEAHQLLESGKVYSGAGAGLKTEYGQTASKLGLGGIAGVDPESTAASMRYKQILSSEVVQRLKSLKGPASNKDMDWATSTVNDPSAPVENKKRALGMLRAQMDAHLRSSEETLKGMGGSPVKVDIPAAGGATAAPAAAADPLEGRTATGPDGKKIVRRGGKWEPM
jgi:hypothetical protein